MISTYALPQDNVVVATGQSGGDVVWSVKINDAGEEPSAPKNSALDVGRLNCGRTSDLGIGRAVHRQKSAVSHHAIQIVIEIVRLTKDGQLQEHVRVSAAEFVLGLLIAIVLGMAIRVCNGDKQIR